ncbi:hypothetical protein IHE44_0013043 [Lamprotornis superbus]|uniref:Uncharacterized protein n=1 Tax=Lamprotornis superbus TaxID=245042 RepID=A0A835U100_9PASS|nr:hypothetical protein IHE44_0013043 [Lamprotornis superbus]
MAGYINSLMLTLVLDFDRAEQAVKVKSLMENEDLHLFWIHMAWVCTLDSKQSTHTGSFNKLSDRKRHEELPSSHICTESSHLTWERETGRLASTSPDVGMTKHIPATATSSTAHYSNKYPVPVVAGLLNADFWSGKKEKIKEDVKMMKPSPPLEQCTAAMTSPLVLCGRKKSWEEHVTQWMGLALEPVEYNTACRHGLVADNLQTSMEKDEVSSVDRKEKCASFPECYYSGEVTGFPEKQLGNISKEVDENDNHEDEEHFLEASTETLVHVSDDDDDYSALNLDSVNYHITAVGSEPKDEGHNLNGAGSLTQMVPITAGNKAAESSGISGDISEEPGCDTAPKEESKEDVCGSIGQSLELCNYEVLNEELDVEKENCINSPNVKEAIMSGKQLLHTAVIAQQRRKSDAFKDGLGKSECNVVESGISSESYTSGDGQLCSAVQPSNGLMQSPPCSCIPAVENGLDESGFTEPQVAPENKCLSNVSSAEDIQCLHVRNHLTTHEYSDNQVKLRKRKIGCLQTRAEGSRDKLAPGEITEDRDRSRLDSMVLLIMKLDQLDQDIENALSAGSSPSSTPTYKRRHIPDVESGSESGVDVASVNHSQTNLSSNTHAPDIASPSSVASSGAKPKAGVIKNRAVIIFYSLPWQSYPSCFNSVQVNLNHTVQREREMKEEKSKKQGGGRKQIVNQKEIGKKMDSEKEPIYLEALLHFRKTTISKFYPKKTINITFQNEKLTQFFPGVLHGIMINDNSWKSSFIHRTSTKAMPVISEKEKAGSNCQCQAAETLGAQPHGEMSCRTGGDGVMTRESNHLKVSKTAAEMRNGCDCQRDHFRLFVYLQWRWFIPEGGKEGVEILNLKHAMHHTVADLVFLSKRAFPFKLNRLIEIAVKLHAALETILLFAQASHNVNNSYSPCCSTMLVPPLMNADVKLAITILEVMHEKRMRFKEMHLNIGMPWKLVVLNVESSD